MKDSIYKEKIERRLAGVIITPLMVLKHRAGAAPETGAKEFTVVDLGRGDLPQCELCDHKNIVNIFKIQSLTTGKTFRVGCECAKNFAEADLVETMKELLDDRYGQARNEVMYEEEISTLKKATKIAHELRTLWRHDRAFNSALKEVDLLPCSKYIYQANPDDLLHYLNKGRPPTRRHLEAMRLWVRYFEEIDFVKQQFQANKQFYLTSGFHAAKSVGQFLVKCRPAETRKAKQLNLF